MGSRDVLTRRSVVGDHKSKRHQPGDAVLHPRGDLGGHPLPADSSRLPMPLAAFPMRSRVTKIVAGRNGMDRLAWNDSVSRAKDHAPQKRAPRFKACLLINAGIKDGCGRARQSLVSLGLTRVCATSGKIASGSVNFPACYLAGQRLRR